MKFDQTFGKTLDKKFIFFVMTSPLFVSLVVHLKDTMAVWQSINSAETTQRAFSSNKIYILVDEFFTMLSYLSPRIYFQAGDGSSLSPKGVEPLSGFLFIFFAFGLLAFIRGKKWRWFLVVGILGVTAYLVGSRSLAFLFPIAIAYLYIVYRYLEGLPYKRIVYLFLSLYTVFLLGRMLWLS